MKQRRLIATTLIFILGSCLCWAQDVKRSTPSAPNNYIANLNWITESWQSDDSRFEVLDREVNSRLHSAKDPRRVVNEYRGVALNNLSDARKVYKWAYAAHQLARHVRTIKEQRSLQYGLYAALLRPAQPRDYLWEPYYINVRGKDLPNSPHSYRYTRLLFLTAIDDIVPNTATKDQFLDVCARLLHRNRQDIEVEYQRIEMLLDIPWSFRTKQIAIRSWAQGLVYSKQLVRKNPKNLACLAQLARAYRFAWDGKNNYGDLSIATYKKYLSMAPSNDPYRKIVEDTIVEIEESKKRFSSRK